jgi:hypothetical protein
MVTMGRKTLDRNCLGKSHEFGENDPSDSSVFCPSSHPFPPYSTPNRNHGKPYGICTNIFLHHPYISWVYNPIN